MAFKMNSVKALLESYRPFGIIGVPKSGKTSLYRDIVLAYCKDENKGLLISCGNEDGYRHLEKLQYETAPIWSKEYGKYEEDLPEELKTRGLIQIIDELIDTKKTNGIQLVCFDTVDELYNIACNQVREEHRKQKGEYPKSINDALGGYGAGRKRVVELVNQQFDRLCKAGYGVFWIGHTKTKEKEDLLTDIKYEKITNNLEDNFFGSIESKSQMVINIVPELEFININSEDYKDFDGKRKTKEIGEVTNVKRWMYFRDTGLVHASCNFAGVPERIELSAENFLKVFEEGVANEKKKFNKDYTQQNKEEDIKKEIELNNIKVESLQKTEDDDAEKKEEIISAIKELVKSKISFKDQIISKCTELKIVPTNYTASSIATLKELGKYLNSLK